MTPATRANFIRWAIAYKAHNFQQSPNEILTQSQQLAIAIHKELPTDGTFLKVSAIAKKLNRKPRQIAEILELVREPWNLKTSKSNKKGGYAR